MYNIIESVLSCLLAIAGLILTGAVLLALYAVMGPLTAAIVSCALVVSACVVLTPIRGA